MAAIAGKFGSVDVGTIQLIDASFSIDHATAEIDYTNLDSSGNKEVIAGIESWSGSVEGFYDGGALPTTAAVKPTGLVTATFTVSSDGTTTNSEAYVGSVLVTSLSISNPVDGAVSVSISFTGSGGLTEGN